MPAGDNPPPESVPVLSFIARPAQKARELGPRRDVAPAAESAYWGVPRRPDRTGREAGSAKVRRHVGLEGRLVAVGARECAVVLRGVAVDCVADHAERMADRVI